MNIKFLLKITPAILLVIFAIFVYWFIRNMDNTISPVSEVVNQVPESNLLALKSQADFKVTETQIYEGGGWNPGFNFRMFIGNNNDFPTEIVSQEGKTHYVGYLSMTENGSTSKVFAGQMLDQNNQALIGSVNLVAKKCILPNKVEVPLTVTIQVGPENVTGCANMIPQQGK